MQTAWSLLAKLGFHACLIEVVVAVAALGLELLYLEVWVAASADEGGRLHKAAHI